MSLHAAAAAHNVEAAAHLASTCFSRPNRTKSRFLLLAFLPGVPASRWLSFKALHVQQGLQAMLDVHHVFLISHDGSQVLVCLRSLVNDILMCVTDDAFHNFDKVGLHNSYSLKP